jgi:hypothetical protein
MDAAKEFVMFARVLLAALWIALPVVAHAQTGDAAHLYAYRLNDKAKFEEGYRRHLAWHADRRDKLAWHAWYVTAGERTGAFVDGTFGATPEALENRIEPDADAADFRANAAPFATALGNEGWMLWRAASRATSLEQQRPDAPVHVLAIKPEDNARFEAAIAARPVPGAAWYRARGTTPAPYLLIVPARSASTLPSAEAIFGHAHPALPLVKVVRAETWQYAPRLALMPGETLKP